MSVVNEKVTTPFSYFRSPKVPYSIKFVSETTLQQASHGTPGFRRVKRIKIRKTTRIVDRPLWTAAGTRKSICRHVSLTVPDVCVSLVDRRSNTQRPNCLPGVEKLVEKRFRP